MRCCARSAGRRGDDRRSVRGGHLPRQQPGPRDVIRGPKAAGTYCRQVRQVTEETRVAGQRGADAAVHELDRAQVLADAAQADLHAVEPQALAERGELGAVERPAAVGLHALHYVGQRGLGLGDGGRQVVGDAQLAQRLGQVEHVGALLPGGHAAGTARHGLDRSTRRHHQLRLLASAEQAGAVDGQADRVDQRAHGAAGVLAGHAGNPLCSMPSSRRPAALVPTRTTCLPSSKT